MTTNPTPADPGHISPTEVAALREDVRLARLILGRIRAAAGYATWGILAGIAIAGAAVITETAWLLTLAATITIVALLGTIGLTLLAAFLGDPPDPATDDRLAAWYPDPDDYPGEDSAGARHGSGNPHYR